jgi:hypothetical protein
MEDAMAEPVTVGAFMVSVLTMAAEATLKGFVGEAVKDSYKALKTQVGRWALGDVDRLAEAPTAGRRLVVAEVIDSQPESNRVSVEQLARTVLDALKRQESEAVGIEVDQFRSHLIDLSGLEVSNGVGLRACVIETEEFVAHDMKVGGAAGKKLETANIPPLAVSIGLRASVLTAGNITSIRGRNRIRTLLSGARQLHAGYL